MPNIQLSPNHYDNVSGAHALPDSDRQEILAKILSRSAKQIVAFDLDSTLLDNRPRSAQIMREFGEIVGDPLLQLADPSHWQGWSTVQAMTNMGVESSDAKRLQKSHSEFWFDRFFTSEYCRVDNAISGAADYVRKLHQQSAVIIYLTGRPEKMRTGTLESFDRLGFPCPGQSRCQLLMKPDLSTSDDDFKQASFETLNKEGHVLAAFDNEPTHINAYRMAFPQAVCVHLLTDHSMRPVRLLDNIQSILHF